MRRDLKLAYCDVDHVLFLEYKRWYGRKQYALKHGQAARAQVAEQELTKIRARFADLYALRRIKKKGDKRYGND
jgi:hypothetical protein